MNSLLRASLIIAWLSLPLIRGQFTPTCENWYESCPLSAPTQNCPVDPCSVPDACPTGYGLTCHSNKCGGCYAICCKTESFCSVPPKLCPDGVTYVNPEPEKNCEYALCPTFLRDIDDILFCATDVYRCPDGSYVSRDPNLNCEFESCIKENSDGIVCAADVQQCPDGSYVSRDPTNNCEFESCIRTEDTVICPLDERRCLDGSYVSRDPAKDCAFDPCPGLVQVISNFIGGLLGGLLDIVS